MILSCILTVVILIANWMLYTKMGRPGWESIIPFYNVYVLFKVLYGNGWKFLWLIVPIVNIYWIFKVYIDLAHAFGQSTGFGIGIVFFSFIFLPILAFGSAQYLDGSYDVSSEDVVSQTFNDLSSKLNHDPNALEKIKQLEELKNSGVISEEEYESKKADLLSRV